MAESKPIRNVYQRLSDAKKLVAKATFTKSKGEGLKFSYLPIEQIKPVVEDAMNEAGLVLLFGDLDTYEIRPTWSQPSPYGGGNAQWFHLGGSQTFAWVNIDSPDDRLEMTFTGEAKDNSDKCVSKLYTAILKNFYKQVFNISTDRKDDPDNTEDERRLEEAGRKKACDIKTQMENDPFFGKREVKKEKETQTDPATLPAEALVTDATLDRPRSVKEDTINKCCGDLAIRKIVVDFCRQKEYGYNTADWTDEQVDKVYAEVIRAGRGRI